MLAGTGHDFDVVQRSKAGLWFWLYTTRSVPDNVCLIHPEDARRRLRSGVYDLTIAHTPVDVAFIKSAFPTGASTTPTALVFHNYRDTEIELSRSRGETHWSEHDQALEARLDGVRPIFISPGKRDSWGVDGDVVLPGIDGDVFRGYEGDELRALRVGNFLVERDLMLGGLLQEQALSGIPTTTLGLNHNLAGSGLSPSFDALKNAYRSHRVYLHTTREGREDGHNLALLEAMATGMPIVALEHSGSPIVDGETGLIGRDAPDLRRGMMRSFDDVDLAHRLGAQARRAVLERFPIAKFYSTWNHIFGEMAKPSDAPRYQGLSPPPKRRRRVLMLYGAYPATTARYLERALRREHLVVTAGPRITPEIWRQWQLENLREPPIPHDIDVSAPTSFTEIWQQLPPGFEPEVVLWIETGLYPPPPGLSESRVPVIGYLIDTHFHLDQHLEWAPAFDRIYLAQKAYVDAFRSRGHDASWLPLACDPEIHVPGSREVEFDVGFIGSLVEPRRVKMIEALMGHFRVYVDRVFLEEMASCFSRAEITWNSAANSDLNMRVFEALAAGCFLLTENLPEQAGLQDLFEDGTHLALYEESSLIERVRHYLARPEERRRIAERGRAWVLAHHTYDHRVEQMLQDIDALAPDRREWAGKGTGVGTHGQVSQVTDGSRG